MPVIYILSSVWVRSSILSQLSIIQSIIQYVGLCVFSLPTPLVMIGRIYVLCLIIIIKSEVWTVTHCLRLSHETMVCAVCLSIFLWRHQMDAFAMLSTVCSGNSLVTGEFPAQRPVTRSFDVYFDLRLNKQLSVSKRSLTYTQLFIQAQIIEHFKYKFRSFDSLWDHVLSDIRITLRGWSY